MIFQRLFVGKFFNAIANQASIVWKFNSETHIKEKRTAMEVTIG
jgi:hypothetical protein